MTSTIVFLFVFGAIVLGMAWSLGVFRRRPREDDDSEATGPAKHDDTPAPVENDPSPEFRKVGAKVRASRWYRNGDHPLDRVGERITDPVSGARDVRREGAVVGYYRHAFRDCERRCDYCGRTMHEHGWLDTDLGGHIVCPGDWVVTRDTGERYTCKPEVFTATYEPTSERKRREPAR